MSFAARRLPLGLALCSTVVFAPPLAAAAAQVAPGIKTLAIQHLESVGVDLNVEHQVTESTDCNHVHAVEFAVEEEYFEPLSIPYPKPNNAGVWQEYFRARVTVLPQAALAPLGDEAEVLQYLCHNEGGAGSHAKNCCNYEFTPGASVRLERDLEVIPNWVETRRTLEFNVPIPGTDAVTSKEVIVPTLNGYNLRKGSWGVTGNEVISIDTCGCDGLGTSWGDPSSLFGDLPVVNLIPPPPTWVLDGQTDPIPEEERGEVIYALGGDLALPLSWEGLDIPRPICTANNDHAVGSAEYETTLKYEWTDVYYSMFSHFEKAALQLVPESDPALVPSCNHPVTVTHCYRYVSKITIRSDYVGDATCSPAPLTGGDPAHSSHAGCDAVCTLDSIPLWFEQEFEQSIYDEDFVNETFECWEFLDTQLVAIKQETVRTTGVNLSFTQDELSPPSWSDHQQGCRCDYGSSGDPGDRQTGSETAGSGSASHGSGGD